ncbi:hypothetical protein Tco_0892261 [Tanacetum coccineum]|uniref:Uncharacterized protein n=1 Tax=Tanacetum coccineum TaxID=301880 RepID=A0ABQ5C705_9ASTR
MEMENISNELWTKLPRTAAGQGNDLDVRGYVNVPVSRLLENVGINTYRWAKSVDQHSDWVKLETVCSLAQREIHQRDNRENWFKSRNIKAPSDRQKSYADVRRKPLEFSSREMKNMSKIMDREGLVAYEAESYSIVKVGGIPGEVLSSPGSVKTKCKRNTRTYSPTLHPLQRLHPKL